MIVLSSVCAVLMMNRTQCARERKAGQGNAGVKIWEVNVLCLTVNRGHRQLSVLKL